MASGFNRPKTMPTKEQLMPLDGGSDEEEINDALEALREIKKQDGF